MKMDTRKHLAADMEPEVGDTCLINGELAMCIAAMANYGGGSGPLWAIENHPCQFTTRRIGRYFEGFCKKVDPENLLVTVRISSGNTWGLLVEGTNVVLHATQFGRYHGLRDASSELFTECDQVVKQVELEKRFIEISLQELRRDIPNAYLDSFNKLLGVEDFKKIEEIALAYQKVISEVNKCEDLIKFHKQQSVRNSGDQFRRKLKQFIDSYNKQED